MKNLHIVFNALSTLRGGGLTVLLGVLQGLHSQSQFGFQGTVICSADETREAIEKQGIAKAIQPLPNAPGIKRQLWANWSMANYVKKLNADRFLSINQYIPGIACPQIVYHLNLLRFMPVAAGIGLKQKLFEHLRNHNSKTALIKADANVFESKYIQDCAQQIHSSNNPLDQVIYIGLPDELVNAPKLNHDSYIPGQLISITNTVPHKDNPTLMRTLAQLVELKPEVDWKLKIAGGRLPHLWEPHKQLAVDLGINERIEWLGFQTQQELTTQLQSSLCMVLTSKVESFCMVAIEAMARGCPAVVSDSAAMPESVGKSGLLATPGDPGSFVQNVLKIHESKEFRSQLVEDGFQHLKDFRWENCGNQFAQLFLDLK